jgi:hypothetical protein
MHGSKPSEQAALICFPSEDAHTLGESYGSHPRRSSIPRFLLLR